LEASVELALRTPYSQSSLAEQKQAASSHGAVGCWCDLAINEGDGSTCGAGSTQETLAIHPEEGKAGVTVAADACALKA